MKIAEFETRRAYSSDADDIAVAHRDSIRSIDPRFYPPDVVDDWSAVVTGDLYVKAMEGGEVDGAQHGTSVYVRGIATRRGIGSTLFRLAEADAIANGATSIQVDASLAAVEFYKANGFDEVARGETRLVSGRPIACVFMRKTLATA